MVSVGQSGEQSFKRIETAGERAAGGLKGLGRQAELLRTGIRTLGGALIAVTTVGGLAALVDRSINAADAIGKTADKIGAGVEALQELRFAAKASGVEQQTLDMALQRFTRRAAEAAQGTDVAKDALAQTGIALRFPCPRRPAIMSARSGTAPIVERCTQQMREGEMFACRSGAPLILASMLTACSGIGDDRASGQASADAAVAGTSAAWGCEDPQPGHPTAAERKAFVQEMGKLAIRAEERHGVPAAAITAMAILESGYGWTRLAQNTNNLLGWKYFAEASAGERDVWVLECPEQGTSDQFIVFRDRAEAVDFVADQLASSENYRADTGQYRKARAGGADVVEAVNRWVDGIADPYSSEPEAWRTAVHRLMSTTYELAEGSPERNLYSLSAAVSPPQA